MDPLIKSDNTQRFNDIDENASTATYNHAQGREGRPDAAASGHAGTNVEPDPRARPGRSERRGARAESTRGPEPRPITYGEIRAWVYAHHGFSPRTGWIAHVKELNSLTLRPTHNRRDSTRIPVHQSAGQHSGRHFAISGFYDLLLASGAPHLLLISYSVVCPLASRRDMEGQHSDLRCAVVDPNLRPSDS